MEKNENEMRQFGGGRTPRIWSGVILLVAGCLLLAYKMGAPIPEWVFTWPVLLIALGILTGVKSRFHNPGALIMILIGSIFLIDQTSPRLNFHDYILPAILIGIGLIYIMRPRRTWSDSHSRRWRKSFYEGPTYTPPANYYQTSNEAGTEEDAEYVEINAVFGSVKKIILSKNFKGGEINCFMGGSELNLMKADLKKQVNLEVNNVFGGAKLIVPSNWNIKNEVTAVFGGIEDKRNVTAGLADPDKILVLHGTCVFGGIEIINY